jgi:hypothetical protein
MLNSSAAKWAELPTPGELNVSLPGCAFTSVAPDTAAQKQTAHARTVRNTKQKMGSV